MTPTSSSPHPILFAHRGARADERENTMAAFRLAARFGANGIETDAWLTGDRVPVLDHDGAVRRRPWRRRTPIAELSSGSLPDHIPTFADLFNEFGATHELSIDLKDPDVWEPIVAQITATAPERLQHVWLCDPDPETLVRIRQANPLGRLVHSTRLARLPTSPETWARRLADARIDAINMRQPDWNVGLVTLFKKFGIRCFMRDVQYARDLAHALSIGVDGIFSDHVRRMVAAEQEWRQTRGEDPGRA